MDWAQQLEYMDVEQLRDLCFYLYQKESMVQKDKAELIHALLHGKKKFLCMLLDKQAIKTLKQLCHHPDRLLHLSVYPVSQLLEVTFIEEVPCIEVRKGYGWYRIRKEAQLVSEQFVRARHYDERIAQMQRLDDIVLGLLHTYGVLDLKQCMLFLQSYGIEVEENWLFAFFSWRLSIRDICQGFLVSTEKGSRAFIKLREIEFFSFTKALHHYPQYIYDFIEEAELRSRKDRYFAKGLAEFEVLNDQLYKRFSHHFIQMNMRMMIDAYQYHVCEHVMEQKLIRVFSEPEIRPYLDAVKAALPDIYRKGHAAWNPIH